MKKRNIRLKLGAIAAALMMLIPLPVRAADEVTFTNFHFTSSPYEDKMQVVVSNVKNNPGSTWYYWVFSLSGVGTIESGKIFFLQSKHGGLGGGYPTDAYIYSNMKRNTELSSSYAGYCPTDIVYTLYATSNDTYGSSLAADISGKWKP